MNKNIWPSRLYGLDVSRGVAALSVVLWHWKHFAYDYNSLSKSFIREDQPFYEILKIFYEKGSMGVDYFFLLSGFIFFWLYRDAIKNKLINVKQFFVQRFSRLYPLHFFTLVIVAILQHFYNQHNSGSFIYPYNDSYHFFLNLCFASMWGFEDGMSFNAPIWSVSIEVLLYVIFFFVALYRFGSILFCLAVSVISNILFFVVSHAIFKGLALFFLGGAIFHITYKISSKRAVLRQTAYIVTIFAWLSVITSFYVLDLSNLILIFGIIGKIFLKGFTDYILFPLTISSLALLEIDNKMCLRRISWIGDITYSSYLLHFPLQLTFGLAVTFGVIERNFFLNPIYFICFFSVLILFSYITYKKFEMPMQKIFRNKFLVR